MLKFDKAFLHGKIYTMEECGACVEAMLVHDGKILAVGTDEEIAAYPVRETIDLQGRPVIPGLIDTHCHIPLMVDDSRKVDLANARSMQEVLDLLAARLPNLKKGQWLLGRGLSSVLLAERRLPDRRDLDRVSREVPIYIMSFDGHSCMGNSVLLAAVGIGTNYQPRPGEIVEMNAGEPTGIFKEATISVHILQHCPSLYADDSDAREAVHQCLLESSRQGYTTMHSILGFSASPLDRASIYQEMEREKTLPMRVNMCYCDCYEDPMSIVSGLGDDMLRLGACKFFADGAMSEWTAYLSQDYADRTGWRGTMVLEPEAFCAKVERAYSLGNEVAIHIIGDAALDIVLDLIERIWDPSRKSRFELIHCAVARPDQLERMKKLPVVIHKQPIFIAAPTTLKGEEKLGDLNRYYHGLHSFLDAGLLVTGGTDGPLSDMNPFHGMACAVSRKAFDGKTVVNPQECIDVYSAVRMFTANAAYAGYEEQCKGTLEAGKLADFIILDRDIFQIDPEEISQVAVVRTYLGGESLYN